MPTLRSLRALLGLVPALILAGTASADTIHTNELISSHTTWTTAGNDHIVVGNLTVVAGVVLTIQDGVTVKFDNGAAVNVSGTLNAIGTSGNGILFTRRDSGDAWGGVRYNPGSSGTVQECTIEYATNGSSYGVYTNTSATVTIQDCLIDGADYGIYAQVKLPTISGNTIQNCTYGLYATGLTNPDLSLPNTFTNCVTSGVTFRNCASPSISNQTITGTTATNGAISMDDTGQFHIGTGNLVTGNTWGLTTDLASYPDLASVGNFPLAGNTNSDGLHVWGGSTNANIPWRVIGVDYIVTANPTVGGGASLTIDDGVTVRFDNGVALNVSGTLNAIATSGNGILFTRRDPGDTWGGVRYNPGSNGVLQHSTIEHATNGSSYGVYANNATVTIEDCLLHLNDYGLYVQNASPTIRRCRIIDNSSYGIYLNGTSVPTFGGSLAEWNDVYGNGGGTADRDLRNGSQDIFASYVYWGVVDEPSIQSRINHEPDNAALGLVTFGPWTNSAHDTALGGDPTSAPIELLPTAFALAQNRPNPVRSTTAIRYALPQDSRVELAVFDVTGRKVATLVDGVETAGFKEVRWDARTVANGVYFYRLQADGFTKTKRVVLLR